MSAPRSANCPAEPARRMSCRRHDFQSRCMMLSAPRRVSSPSTCPVTRGHDRPSPSPSRRRATDPATDLPPAELAAAVWLMIVALSEPFGRWWWGTAQDARSYWSPTLADPYAHASWTTPSAYVYSPAFLQVVAPLALLPWQAFVAAWTGILLGALRFLTGPRLLAVGVLLAVPELAGGNISLLLAVAIVAGVRW